MDSAVTQSQASYGKTNDLATVLLEALADQEASIGYGLLACSLTICRLLNTGREVPDQEEIDFIEALMDWTGAYFPQGGKKGN